MPSIHQSRSLGGGLLVAASNAHEWIRKRADFRCDGTDDDVQIQEAIDAAIGDGTDAYGTKIQLSGGQFNMSSPISWRNNITLAGGGRGVTLLRAANDLDDNMFEFTGTGSNQIFGLIMDLTGEGNSAQQTAGSFFDNTTGPGTVPEILYDMHFVRVYIRNFKEYGIKTEQSWGWGLDDVIIEVCQAGGYWHDSTRGGCSGNGKIRGCKIIKNYEQQIYIKANGYFMIVGNEFQPQEAGGGELEDKWAIELEAGGHGCKIIGNDFTATNLNNGHGHIVLRNGATYNAISGNQLYAGADLGDAGGANQFFGVEMKVGADRNVLAGNTFQMAGANHDPILDAGANNIHANLNVEP